MAQHSAGMVNKVPVADNRHSRVELDNLDRAVALGKRLASDLLDSHPALVDELCVWLTSQLRALQTATKKISKLIKIVHETLSLSV